MIRIIELTTVIVFIVLLLLFWFLKKLKKFIGFKPQKVIYQDSGEVPVLFSQKYHLCGKPDYIIREKGCYIPVEVKNTDRLYETHVAQLLAYCPLIEENFAKTPPYGILKLRSREEKIVYDREARKEILKTVSEMSKALHSANRSHQSSNRCRACLVASNCDQKLT